MPRGPEHLLDAGDSASSVHAVVVGSGGDPTPLFMRRNCVLTKQTVSELICITGDWMHTESRSPPTMIAAFCTATNKEQPFKNRVTMDWRWSEGKRPHADRARVRVTGRASRCRERHRRRDQARADRRQHRRRAMGARCRRIERDRSHRPGVTATGHPVDIIRTPPPTTSRATTMWARNGANPAAFLPRSSTAARLMSSPWRRICVSTPAPPGNTQSSAS